MVPTQKANNLTEILFIFRIIPKTAAKEAAFETPSVSGEAMGFPNNAWYAQPDIANAVPIKQAPIIRGRRNCRMTASVLEEIS